MDISALHSVLHSVLTELVSIKEVLTKVCDKNEIPLGNLDTTTAQLTSQTTKATLPDHSKTDATPGRSDNEWKVV